MFVFLLYKAFFFFNSSRSDDVDHRSTGCVCECAFRNGGVKILDSLIVLTSSLLLVAIGIGLRRDKSRPNLLLGPALLVDY